MKRRKTIGMKARSYIRDLFGHGGLAYTIRDEKGNIIGYDGFTERDNVKIMKAYAEKGIPVTYDKEMKGIKIL